jgi:hypothetical protein
MPVSIAYTFGTATGSIPLTQLDANFLTLQNGINGMLDGSTQTFTNIVTSGGTIGGTTVWSAATIAATRGGTGVATYTTGDILYASAANTLSKLPVGSTGQVLTVAGGIPSWGSPASGTITNNTTPISGGTAGAVLANSANTVGQILPGTSGNVLLSNGTAWSSGVLQYTATGTGAAARTYPSKLGDIVSVLDYNCPTDGTTDCTAAFNAAITSLGALGGTVIVPPGIYTIDGVVNVGKVTSPYISNVTLKGQTSFQTQPFENSQLSTVSCIKLNGSTGRIRLAGGCGIDGFRIIRKGMTFAANAAASFTGTAIDTASVPAYGSYVFNCMIVGFNQAINMDGGPSGSGGYEVKDVYIDCNNGVIINNSQEVSRIVRVHCFPFATIGFTPTTSQIQRSGYAFRFTTQNDWTTMVDCFSYGYFGGIYITGIATMQITGCQSDNTTPGYNGSFGFAMDNVTGESNVNLTGCNFAASQNLVYLNIIPASAVVKFSNCDFWGANDSTGTVGTAFNFVAGTAFAQNCFFYRNKIGLAASAGYYFLQNCYFYNNTVAWNFSISSIYGSGVATKSNTSASTGTIQAMPTTIAIP